MYKRNNNSLKNLLLQSMCCLMMVALVIGLMPLMSGLAGWESNSQFVASAATDNDGLSVKNLWASEHAVGKVKFKWTAKDGVKASGWNLEYRMRKIGGNNKWSKWTYLKNLPVSVGGAGEKAGKWIDIPKDYVIEIHAQAVGDTTWSRGIITTPAGGKYQAMKYAYARYAGTKQRVSDTLVIGLGKSVTVTPDCEYPVKDTKKRPKLYPSHLLYDVEDTSIISIKNSKGQVYKGGIIDGNATIRGDKVGETTLIFRAPNGRTQIVTVEVVDKVNGYTSSAEKTFVFFGSDSRAKGTAWKTDKKSGTEGKPRSDSIMIFRVNPKAGTIDLVSVYRDTMMDVSGKSNDFQKANKAYSDGGPKKAVEMLERNLNIKIDGYAVSNFKGVADVIDALGGVTINIEADKAVSNYAKYKNVPGVMNNAIDEMNRVYGTRVKHITKTGKQKLNGAQAVSYARVRATDGGDMRRTVRQRAVVTQMISKYKGLSRAKKLVVLATVFKSIDTNMSVNDIKSLASIVATSGVQKKVGFPFYKKFYVKTTNKERLGKSNLFVPCNLQKNVVRLHKTVYGQSKYKASSTVKTLSKKIVKETKLDYKNRTKAYDNKF